MINPAVFTTTFLAAAVEIIEMVIIVVGVGAIRGWRSTLLGTGAGLAVVAALIVALGTALTYVPINGLRVVAGSLLFVFGLQWLRKGIRRVAANGLRGMGARNATDDDIPAHGVDWIAFLLAFRGVVLEGLEVAIIVATFGAAARAFPSAALAAAAALVVIGAAGALARRLVERIPRSALQLLVGTLLSAFGSFWAVEGLGIAWPGADLFIIALAAWYVLAAAWYIRRAAAAGPACQPARSPVREVNHDRFLAVPGGDREPSRARGLREVLVRVRHRRRLDRRGGRGGRAGGDLAAAHRGRGGMVAATAGRGGRDRGQPSPHQGMSAQQPVLTPVLAVGRQPTPGSEPQAWIGGSSGRGVSRTVLPPAGGARWIW